MFSLSPNVGFLALLILLVYTRPTLAFGAGNIAEISKAEGARWRHGDIEDILLTILMARGVGGKKFNKLNVSRVYFGNWLRDYSQAIDVGTVKSVSAEAIRLLLSVLGFMTFGYGSREFEVTAERLGCYRPEDHIDNPKNYADNIDARQYDRRLRAPVDEETELAVDPETGMKNYIANEGAGIMTSAQHVRQLFSKCIQLGRRSRGDDADLHEALRLLGTGLHCLEDYLAHSNYTELVLIELGERDVFPHVGRRTKLSIPGARREVYPIVTGTFGGVDFLHSVTGEVSDKLTQNEIDELEGALEHAEANPDDSVLQDVFNMIPNGGDKKNKMNEIQEDAHNNQMGNTSISPRDPEEFTLYAQNVFRQIMPAIEFHDNLMKDLSKFVESIPLLSKILERFEQRMSMWVFTIIAPFVIPIIRDVKNELHSGSNEIIESSKREQHIVFEDDHSTDPTHSMLSKDHFSNVLNGISGKTAQAVVAWVVPQIMEAWDDDGVDVDRLMTRIVNGVLHHPAQRDQGEDGAEEGRRVMFSSIEEWWNTMPDDVKEEHRRYLSREGVENGENHQGALDTGHGCGGPLHMHNNFAKGGSLEDRIAGKVADALVDNLTGGISKYVKQQTGADIPETGGGGGGGYSGGGGFGGFFSSLLGSSSGGQESSSYSRREESYESHQDESESYNRYERREDRSEEYGGYEQRERYESREESYGGGYGRRHDDEEQEEPEEDQGYRRRRDDEEEENEGYGRRRRDEEEEENEGYGRRRRDDEEEEQQEEEDDSYRRRRRDEDEGGWGF
ncbi:hypothetical protein TWF481_004383 [Arthrobotrys musiformis]|uniref:Uncharacterized protein n=1 Tax=Arthrobotrys musiformis TaxID=47236 RepID=A0AAV9WJE6_9PEZI